MEKNQSHPKKSIAIEKIHRRFWRWKKSIFEAKKTSERLILPQTKINLSRSNNGIFQLF